MYIYIYIYTYIYYTYRHEAARDGGHPARCRHVPAVGLGRPECVRPSDTL